MDATNITCLIEQDVSESVRDIVLQVLKSNKPVAVNKFAPLRCHRLGVRHVKISSGILPDFGCSSRSLDLFLRRDLNDSTNVKTIKTAVKECSVTEEI